MFALMKLLLEEQGVRVFPSLAIGKDHFSFESLKRLYGAAFDYSGGPQVTVAIGGPLGTVFVTTSLDQLYRNLGRFEGHDIDAVLLMPLELWEKVRARLEPDAIVYLAQVETA